MPISSPKLPVRLAVLSLLLLLLIAAGVTVGLPGSRDDARAAPPLQERVVVVADGLEVPWAMDFAPDGRIFLTERGGRVRVIHPDRGLEPEPWLELDVAEGGDGGLQGIALAPDFARSGHVYVMGTFAGADDLQESRILRFTDRDGRAAERTLVFGPVAAPGVHRGGGLAFGPDGMLYASVGDTRQLELVQDPSDPRGSILRLHPDGTVPDEGPFPGSPVWATGVRNSQGLVFDPASGDLFASEHGPSDFPGEHGWTGRDEVNVIVRGGNYGWPHVAGDTVADGFRRPLAAWSPAVAPGGIALQRVAGSPGPVLWVGALRGERLIRLELAPAEEAEGWRVVEETHHVEGRFGRIRAVAWSPDGALYFTTSNQDSDGRPDAPPDRLLRVDPDSLR